MDCDTTGVEPDFSLVKFKKLAGGGYFKIINTSLPPALRKLGYDGGRRSRTSCATAWAAGPWTARPAISSDALRQKGFTDEAIDKVNASLANAFSTAFSFSWVVLGKEFLENTLGIPETTFSQAGFSLLKHLGFSAADIEAADLYACGTMTIEGAPHLKPEHYAVFDTASPNGKIGKRSIPWKAHIEMMAAVQPFISGAISKTINMPSNATIDDIKGAYLMSWRKMLKAIALYRDGSKLSQPLSSLMPGSDAAAAAVLAIMKESGDSRIGLALTPGRSKKRDPLPAKRFGYTQKAKIGGHSIFLRTGQYEDGTAGRDLPRHAQGRRRVPLPAQQLRHRRIPRPAVRRSPGRVRGRVHLHALRAQRHGERPRPHQDDHLGAGLHLPRPRPLLPGADGPRAGEARRPDRHQHEQDNGRGDDGTATAMARSRRWTTRCTWQR